MFKFGEIQRSQHEPRGISYKAVWFFFRKLLSYIKYNCIPIQVKRLYKLNVEDIKRLSCTNFISLEYRFATLRDVLLLEPDYHDFSEKAKKYAQNRFKAGDLVIIGFLDNLPVFYVWLMFSQMGLAEDYYVLLPQTSIYTYKAFTVKDLRGNKFLQNLYPFLKDFLIENSYDTIFTTVANNNMPAIIAHERIGYKIIMKNVYI